MPRTVNADKDFGELAIVRELPPSGTLRLVGLAALHQAEATLTVIDAHEAESGGGAIITAGTGRLRVRAHGSRS